MKIIFEVSNRRINISSNVHKIFVKSIGFVVQLYFSQYQKYWTELYQTIILKGLVSLYPFMYFSSHIGGLRTTRKA